MVVDATAGCANVFPCNISITVTGATEANADFVGIWRVTSSSAPRAALGSVANRAAILSGPLSYSGSVSSATGMLLVTFSSSATVTAAGWSVAWRAVPPPLKWCTTRTVAGGSGVVEDGSAGANN